MMRKTHGVITGFTVMFVLTLFMAVSDSAAMSTAPGIYHFYGRVLNQEDKPVGNCSVVLTKSFSHKVETQEAGEEKTEEMQTVVTDETVVAVTPLDGNFSFAFEPLSATDFWVYFMAEGYETRPVELNKLMKSRFFKNPNKSPIHIVVVLEKN